MKNFIFQTTALTISFFIFIISITVGSVYWWYHTNTAPLSDSGAQKEFVIEPGESFGQVAQRLEDEGFIRNAFAFRLWEKMSGDGVVIQAGSHQIAPTMTFLQIAQELSVGIQDVRVTIREGVRVEEIDEIFAQSFTDEYDSSQFLVLAKPNEGMLFPDTYIFQKTTSAAAAYKKLNDEFESRYRSAGGSTDPAIKKRTIILASLLEREGKSDQDRPVIAGVLLNRINNQTEAAGLLQVDATLQYAKNERRKSTSVWWPAPSPEDKEINSDYNTYKNTGLPPAPICNPGFSALKAAINPTTTSYIYYIHDNSGKAHYATTLDEHNRNIERYLN